MRETRPAATLSAFLAGRRSPAAALIADGRTMSYAALDDAARRLARGLAELGVGPGDRVALWLPNGVAWLALFFACARLGAIAVAVNTRFRSAEVGDILGRTGCKVLALRPGFKGIDFAGILADVDPAALDRLEALIACPEPEGAAEPAAPPPLPGRRLVDYGALVARPPLDEDRAAPDSGCVVFTTSGTTGAPKFVLHSHGSVVRHGRDVARAFGYGTAPETVALVAVPLCGTYGLAQAAAALAAGRPLALMPLFDPDSALRLAREHRVTHMCGTDGMIARMLAASDAERPLPSLAWYGYARFDPALADVVESAETRGVRLRGLFGMSETQALFAAQPLDDPGRCGLPGGVPVSPEAAARVRDPETGRLRPEGEPGEIELRGPSLMAGYLGDPEATRSATTEDGFFRTGDLGYATADGGFVFLARAGDALRLGGHLVSPAEIESYLLRHPAVDGCQVVGAGGPSGPRAVAFVTLRAGEPGVDEAELRRLCRAGLAGFKVPERIVTLERFPTTDGPNGVKVQRGRLREMAAALLAATAGGG